MMNHRLCLKGLLIILGISIFPWAIMPQATALADNGPHGGYTSLTDACAGCHRAHTAAAARLLIDTPIALCFTCHDSASTGADTNVTDGIYLERDGNPEFPVEGMVNRGLKAGGFQNALIDTDRVITTVAVITPTTSGHLYDASTGTVWGNGAIGSGPGALNFSLSCVSCHDPHGGGNYRILRPIPTGSGAGIPITVTDEISKTYTVSSTNNSDPLFVGGTPYNYHLRSISSAIDAGTSDGAPVDDIDGDSRPQGSFYDIGSDEVLIE